MSAGAIEGHFEGTMPHVGRSPRGGGGLVLACNTLAHWALATQKKLAYLDFHCLDEPPNQAQLDYHLFPGNTIESSPFFI
jgi:hypothetical protein